MPSTVLITGTDAGVGKTWVGCGLAGTLRRAGRTVLAVKPVETGCDETTAADEDGVRLAKATGQREPLRALRRLRAQTAPAVAADLEGLSIDLDQVASEIEGFARSADLLLLEGVDGLLAPLGWDWTIVDLAQVFEATALVVASDRFGSINHTLLTLSALDFAGLRVAGIVLDAPASPDAATGSTAGAIARLSGIERIHTLPRTQAPEDAAQTLVEISAWL